MKALIAVFASFACFIAFSQPLQAATFEEALATERATEYETAIAMYRELALQGDVNAQNRLGLLYIRGRGVEQDLEEAAKWYRMAAEAGDASAQYELASMYFGNAIPTEDFTEAAALFKKSAEQGFTKAEVSLGTLYLRGDVYDVDYGEAMKWYQRAAEHGSAEAQYNLGNMYILGLDVPEDMVRGAMWVLVSIENPDVGMNIVGKTKVANMVGAKMTEEQRTQARTMANECKAKHYKDC